MSPEQITFDQQYISSTEIMNKLSVTRTAMSYARKRGLLPGAIVVNDGRLFLWEREKIEPNIEAWLLILNLRRKSEVDGR